MIFKTANPGFFPVITASVGIICIGLFVGINLEESLDSWDAYRRWGAPSPSDIFSGSYWGLVSSNFLHLKGWHIAFNLFWLWFFGQKIEFEKGKPFYIFLILSSALISSLAELGFTNDSGIGFSGIGYAMFGYIWIKSRYSENFRYYLHQSIIILFLVWLVFCYILTITDIWVVGNAAHFFGMIWGMLIAYGETQNQIRAWLMNTGFFVLVATAILWNPYATSWLMHKAYTLHLAGELESASEYYEQILERDPDNFLANDNYPSLRIDLLQQRAFSKHSDKDYEGAREIYNELLELDPDNEWAKENLKRLPLSYSDEYLNYPDYTNQNAKSN